MIDQRDIKIGDWWAACCVHDLEHIATVDELDDAREFVPFTGAWRTLDEALDELLTLRYYGRQTWLDDDIAYARTAFPHARRWL